MTYDHIVSISNEMISKLETIKVDAQEIYQTKYEEESYTKLHDSLDRVDDTLGDIIYELNHE